MRSYSTPARTSLESERIVVAAPLFGRALHPFLLFFQVHIRTFSFSRLRRSAPTGRRS